MPALTLRPTPLPRVAAVFALPAIVLAMAGGAGPAVAVAAACACASGAIVGAGGRVTVVAAWLAVLAVGAVVVVAIPGHGTATPAGPAPPVVRHADHIAPPPPRHEAVRPRRTPAGLVRAYYAALDAHDYARAWARLSPAVRARFGGFDTWRRGYATTLGHRVEGVGVQPGGVVRLTLVATDRTPCGGTTEQRFAVTWQLVSGKATALGATRLAGEVPAAAC